MLGRPLFWSLGQRNTPGPCGKGLVKEPRDVPGGIDAPKESEGNCAAEKGDALKPDSPAGAGTARARNDAEHRPTGQRKKCEVDRWDDDGPHMNREEPRVRRVSEDDQPATEDRMEMKSMREEGNDEDPRTDREEPRGERYGLPQPLSDCGPRVPIGADGGHIGSALGLHAGATVTGGLTAEFSGERSESAGTTC